MFCPPVLYAPSTDEINGFALSITKKLVEIIGIYFPEEVEKQKSKKTEDESGVVKFAAKMKSWRSARKSYKDALSTQLNGLYRKIIENAYNAIAFDAVNGAIICTSAFGITTLCPRQCNAFLGVLFWVRGLPRRPAKGVEICEKSSDAADPICGLLYAAYSDISQAEKLEQFRKIRPQVRKMADAKDNLAILAFGACYFHDRQYL